MAFLPFAIENINLEDTTSRQQRLLYGYLIVRQSGKYATLHLFETDKSRQNSLKHYKRELKIMDAVFMEFEIPLMLYIKSARKSV